MLGFVGGFVGLFVVAWISRALLGARELTWSRLFLATLVGVAVGDPVALMMLTTFENVDNVDFGQLQAVSFPFRLIATMGAVVVLELIRSSRRPRRERRRRPLRFIRNLFVTTRRGMEVLGTMARHGFSPLRPGIQSRDPEDLAHRARLALEEAGGMFVKLGQLLAARPDLLPPKALAEFSLLQASASPLPWEVAEAAIAAEIGAPPDSVFSTIDPEPLGSASIAQVHAATLVDGTPVVVKIRRPGLEDQVDTDLTIVSWLARMAARRTEWGRAYDVDALAEEFGRTLRDELDFRVEERNAIEIRTWLLGNPEVAAPMVIERITTPRMLVMERFTGTPLANLTALPHPDAARRLADALCVSQVTAMVRGEPFHGDPHAGNVMLLDNGQLGLIDFGVAGRLDTFERASIFQLLIALDQEQPAFLHEALVSMGALHASQDPNQIERALAQFMSAHLSNGLPPPDALNGLLRLARQLQLKMPASTTTMIRALDNLAGTLERLSPDYPLFEVIGDLGGAEIRQRAKPDSLHGLVQQEWTRLTPLISRAPRHFDRLATLLTHGRLTTRVRLFTEPEDVHVLERLVNRSVLALLSIGVGAVSVSLLHTDSGPEVIALDLPLTHLLGWVGMGIAVIALLRVLLSLLRSDTPESLRG